MYITLCRVMAELNFIRVCHNLNCVYQWVMPWVLQEIELLSAQSTVMFALNFGCMLSVGATCFEDRFCASKMGGIGEGGQAYSRHAVHMEAVLAGCRKALVGTGWTISQLVSTNEHRNHSSPFLKPPFLELQVVVSQEEHSLVGEP